MKVVLRRQCCGERCATDVVLVSYFWFPFCFKRASLRHSYTEISLSAQAFFHFATP